jgi:hypothetical protein
METTTVQDIREIRQMMEKSSRFISLSGWSGVAAGTTALVGAWTGRIFIKEYYNGYGTADACSDCLKMQLVAVAASVFMVALGLAFLFTYIRAKKEGVAIWSPTARKLMWNTLLPMVVGGIVILRLMDLKDYSLIPATSLIFYGLALVNGSKYTVGEIRFLGYGQLLAGIFCLWYPQQGLLVWAFGFGILHILYGVAMWWKYERK